MKKKNYRYVEKTCNTQTDYSIHVRELINSLKHEKIKESLYVKHVKLSNHAYVRFQERVNPDMSLATATKHVRDLLKDAKRVGSIVSYDGRLSVLYTSEGLDMYLSPDLKTLITISQSDGLNLELLKDKLPTDRELTKDELLQLHLDEIALLEEEERKQLDVLLKIESNVSETHDICRDLITTIGRRHRTKSIREAIGEQSYLLKKEGKKMFRISVRKRMLLRSMTGLLQKELTV